jgi:hypothetical protein
MRNNFYVIISIVNIFKLISITPRLKKIAVFENTQKKWFVGSFYTHPLYKNHGFQKYRISEF